MRAKYFPDTDTLLLIFSDNEVTDSFDLNENVLLEVDQDERIVSITIENAAQQTDVIEFSYHYQLAAA